MTDAQADIGRLSPFVADEILADLSPAFHVPVLVATLAARRRIPNIQRVAIWRRAVGRDQEGRTPTIVHGVANEAPRIGLEKPVLTRIERRRARISGSERGAVNRNARIAGLDILVAAHIEIHFMPRRRDQAGINRGCASRLSGSGGGGTGCLRERLGWNECDETCDQEFLQTMWHA